MPENPGPAHSGPIHRLWEPLVFKALTCQSSEVGCKVKVGKGAPGACLYLGAWGGLTLRDILASDISAPRDHLDLLGSLVRLESQALR